MSTALLAGTEKTTIGDIVVTNVYSTIAAEYRALRSSAGLLDHSGVGLIACRGAAAGAVAALVSRDVGFLVKHRCTTAALLGEDGTVIDVLTMFGVDDGLLLQTSRGRRHATLAALKHHVVGEGVVDLSDDYAAIGLEGPYSWGVVGRVFGPEHLSMAPESIHEVIWDGGSVHMARTGFTGEYGYQWIGARHTITSLFEELARHAIPVGQAALEVAMLEVSQPMVAREAISGADVRCRGWTWMVDQHKPAFLGRTALLGSQLPPTGTVGFRGGICAVPVRGDAVILGREAIGVVVTAVRSPETGEVMGLAEVDRELLCDGLDLHIDLGGELHPVRTASSPYRVPTSWSVRIVRPHKTRSCLAG